MFGLGGNGERRASESGGAERSGPRVAGPGVLGHGGRYRNILGGTVEVKETTGDGAGVIGISGDLNIGPPEDPENLGAGVVGKGNLAGVRGLSENGAGVVGKGSQAGRGGVFASEKTAQVKLQPQLRDTTDDTQALIPQSFVIGSTEADPEIAPLKLPKDGQEGDLIATTKPGPPLSSTNPEENVNLRRSALWFCTRGLTEDGKPALWREVLMGQEFSGEEDLED